jgi:hypothetical protein
MTGITTTFPDVASRRQPAVRRSPIRVVSAGVSRLLRSYNDHLKADSFIVPNGHMAAAAGSAKH